MTSDLSSTPSSSLGPGQIFDSVDNSTSFFGRSATSAGRAILTRLLGRMERGQLTITDIDGKTSTYGTLTGPNSVHAELTVLDDRAWLAVARHGAVGLGRGYIKNWWDSPDPTAVVQVLCRQLPALERYRSVFTDTAGRVRDIAKQLLPRVSRQQNRQAIAAHYDLGNDFFRLFLDETLTYSAAAFADHGQQSLAAASENKYDRLLTKLGVTDEMSILEIGTGWGGFAIRAAEQFGCTVTSTTVSQQQYEEATRRVSDANLDSQIKLLTTDWRDLTGTYDRIASIEMIEAVEWRDYGDYFATIEKCLRPDGLVGIQAICTSDKRWERQKSTVDFIRHFVFPGGMLPSLGSINDALTQSTSLTVVDVEDLTAHYAETLQRWLDNFERNLDEIKAIGLDDRFCRLWRFYLAYCRAGFLERYCTLYQFVLAGQHWRNDTLALRPC